MADSESVQLVVSHQTRARSGVSEVFRTSVKFCGVEIGHLITEYRVDITRGGPRLILDFGPACLEIRDERGGAA